MFRILGITLGLSICFISSVHASERYYDPIVDLNARIGSKRDIGRVEFSIPIEQTKDRLLFADFRTMISDQSEREGNFGLGYRQVIELNDQDFIAGGYGFFDRRRSEYGNLFNQLTFGAELLGPQWRLRTNYYHPLTGNKTIEDDPDTATLTPEGFVLVNPNKVEEEPLNGMDLEFGIKVPFIEEKETWAHRGVYRFGIGKDTPDLNGVRFRGETQITDWLRLGIESSYDNVRKDSHFFDIRIRIPLQKTISRKKKQALHAGIHRYMQEPIVRDVDIVATNKTLKAALALSGGTAERYFFVDNTAGAGGNGKPNNPFNTLAAAESAVKKNSTIVVRLGDGTTTNMDAGITISKKNVRLLGTGIDITTREGVLIEDATAAPRITNTAGDAVHIDARDVEVAGFAIDNPTADGIFVLGEKRAYIHNNTITGAGNNGINAAYTSNNNRSVTIVDNTISGSTLRGITVRAFNGADVTAIVTGNNSTGNTQEAIKYEVGATNSTLDVTSTNNVANTSGGVAGLYAVSAGSGALTLDSNGDSANNNTQHGLFALLGGTDTHDLTILNASANMNGQIGIGVDVQDSTTVTATLNSTSATNNSTDGLNIISRSDSSLNASVSSHTSTGNTDQGVDITSDGTTTSMTIALSDINVSTSGNSGMFLRARSAGTLNATLTNSTIDNNTASGLFIEGATTANTTVKIDTTDVTNSTVFNLNLLDNTSGTYNVDFGGGALSSVGQNRIFTSGNVDVFGNLNGSAVSAQSNWWGTGAGLLGGELNLISGGSIDATSPLASDPRP